VTSRGYGGACPRRAVFTTRRENIPARPSPPTAASGGWEYRAETSHARASWEPLAPVLRWGLWDPFPAQGDVAADVAAFPVYNAHDFGDISRQGQTL
jgi:hypothetical protein